VDPALATKAAALATNLAVSLIHYARAAGEPFRLVRFAVRTFAAMFFALLFMLRGFGITDVTHAAYDLIVGLALTGSNRRSGFRVPDKSETTPIFSLSGFIAGECPPLPLSWRLAR
jgi:hypothetical protein